MTASATTLTGEVVRALDPVVAGGSYFAKIVIFDREVLDTRPGIDEFAAAPEAVK